MAWLKLNISSEVIRFKWLTNCSKTMISILATEPCWVGLLGGNQLHSASLMDGFNVFLFEAKLLNAAFGTESQHGNVHARGSSRMSEFIYLCGPI